MYVEETQKCSCVTKMFCIALTSGSPLVQVAAAPTIEFSKMILLVLLTTMIKGGVKRQHVTLHTHPCSIFVSTLFVSFLSKFPLLQCLWRPPSLPFG